MWSTVEKALETDRVQVVFEIMRRGMVFHDEYWWLVMYHTDVFAVEPDPDSDVEVIDLLDDSDSDDDDVQIVHVVPI